MPSNEFFSFNILVGHKRIPEYTKDGSVYVESNLWTAHSYSQTVSSVVNGEIEEQSMPVTPYQIEVHAKKRAKQDGPYYFRVLVDGSKVKGISLLPGRRKGVKGFRDGVDVRELLFSMPNLKSKMDKEDLPGEKLLKVGHIEVECWSARLLAQMWELRQKSLDFKQASKSDSLTVTKGLYTMATSAVGKQLCKKHIYRNVDQWKRVELLSKLSVQYHMGHTLQAMGIVLLPDPGLSFNSTREGHEKPIMMTLKSDLTKTEEKYEDSNLTDSQRQFERPGCSYDQNIIQKPCETSVHNALSLGSWNQSHESISETDSDTEDDVVITKVVTEPKNYIFVV